MNYTEYLKEVGLNVNTLLSPFTTSHYASNGSRVFNGRAGNVIEAVILHTTGNTASAKDEASNIHNNKPSGTGSSFHAVADKNGVYECVRFDNSAYHAGHKGTNLVTLGFELTDDNAAAGYDNYIKYVAWVMYQENLTPSNKTVLFHNEIVSTSCGSFLRNKGKSQIIADLNRYISIAKGGGEVSELIPRPNKVGQVLKVRKGSYTKPTFTAYEDATCTIPLEPWTVANYDFDLGFKIVEDLDPVFKCSQYSVTPMGGIKHVYIKWESGIGFDAE